MIIIIIRIIKVITIPTIIRKIVIIKAIIVKLDHLISHIIQIDLDKDKSPKIIAKSLEENAVHLHKKESIGVSNSNLVLSNDRYSERAVEVNVSLKEFFFERNIYLTDHKSPVKHPT